MSAPANNTDSSSASAPAPSSPSVDNSSSASAPAPSASRSSSTTSPPQALPTPGLYAPSLAYDNIPDTSLATVVARLMNPPAYLYSADGGTVTIYIVWAVGIVGPERFERAPGQGRHQLRSGDELLERGVGEGLDERILAWLRSGREDTLVLKKGVFE